MDQKVQKIADLNIDTQERLNALGRMAYKVAKAKTVGPNEPPKKNCKHCYGRGYIGWDPSGQKVPCRCTRPKSRRTG